MKPTLKRPIHPVIREAASEVLVAAGRQSSLEIVVSLLDDPNIRVKWNALTTLATYGQDVPLSVIAQVSRNTEEYPPIRKVAVETLGAIGTAAAIQVVLEHAGRNDEPEVVRWSAIRVLGEVVAEPSAEMFASVATAIHEDRAGKVPAAAGRTLAKWVGYILPDAELMLRLIELALGEYPMVNPDIRDGAADALIALKETTAHVDVLVDVLAKDRDAHRRTSAAHLLGLLHAPVAVEPLIHALNEDQNEGVRWASAYSLGRRYTKGDISRDMLLQHLLHLLEASTVGLHWSALRGLAELAKEAPPVVEEILVAELRSNSEERRYEAIELLRRMLGNQIPIQAFLDGLQADEGNCCDEIVQALGDLGERMPVSTLVEVLSNTDPEANVNRSNPPWARVSAAYALAELKEAAPVEPLISAAQLDDKAARRSWEYVRVAALHALGKLGRHASLDVISFALGDTRDMIRSAAATAAAGLSERAPVELLLYMVGDRSWQVRYSVLDTLKQVAPDALRLILREAEAILQGDEQAAHYLAPLLGKLTI